MGSLRPALRRLLRDRSGATAVEMAFVLPVFLLIVGGLFEFGRFMYVRNSIQYAAEEAARVAMVDPTATTATIEATARDRMGMLPLAGFTVTVTTQSDGTVNFIVVDTTYAWASEAFGALVPGDLRLARGRARVPIVQ